MGMPPRIGPKRPFRLYVAEWRDVLRGQPPEIIDQATKLIRAIRR